MTYLQLLKYVDRTSCSQEELRLMTEMAPHWKEIANLLGVGHNKVLSIEGSNLRSFENCLMHVMNLWADNGHQMPNHKQYPETWSGVRQLLLDIQQKKLAKKLEAALSAESSNIRGSFRSGMLREGGREGGREEGGEGGGR